MGILDKIGGAGKSVSDRTKNISDASNLKNKTLYEEERILEIYAEIGQRYYEDSKGNAEKMDELCADIDTRKARIQKMKLEFQSIKGFKVCPQCKTKLTDKFVYCGKCGAKLPDLDEAF